VSRFRQGGRKVAEALYREHGPGLFGFLVRYTGDPALAEDVLHDVFQRLLERPPSSDGSSRGWLYRVAVNRVRDVQRGRRRRARLDTDVAARKALADPPGPTDGALDALDARRRARHLLDALPDRDRTLLLMRQDGFTHREIAEAVGTTTGSVGTLIARALGRVRKLLDQSEVAEEVSCL
jgi:RNA polymerase sigma-70 factor (ECF subfamily)